MEIPKTDADIVVLLGDIGIGIEGIKWASLFPQTVLYVAGNHEHYGKEIENNLAELKTEADKYENVIFLENDSYTLGGITFHGCTLWTNFELYGMKEDSMARAAQALSDFSVIGHQDKRLSPQDTVDMYLESTQWLNKSLSLSKSEVNIVLSHHLPTDEAIQIRYIGNILSPAFASNCFDELSSHKIGYWFYGHNHDVIEFEHKGTTFLTNQRGYAPDDITECFDAFKIMTIENISI
jgi:hypothetical protein